MIKIVVNDKEAVLKPEHFVVLGASLMHLRQTMQERIQTEFINGNAEAYNSLLDDYSRAGALLDAINALGNGMTPEQMAEAITFVSRP